MPPKRTYGSKRANAAKGSSAIFGSTTSSSPINLSNASKASRSPQSDKAPITALADALASVTLDSISSNVDADTESCSSTTFVSQLEDPTVPRVKESSSENSAGSSDDSGSTPSEEDAGIEEDTAISHSPILPGLEALAAAHLTDTQCHLSVLEWSAVIPPTSTISKIAEASYAEVYRVETANGSSIIKILQLQVPSDITSLEIETANKVTDVVSELRIMNALTEVPGFVTFKGTYIVHGPPPDAIIAAYQTFLEKYQQEEGSNFPDPKDAFNTNSTFLVLELGDAGDVMESVEVYDISQVWDLFLGTVMALSRAEITNEFEHRDLHENNICVRYKHSGRPYDPDIVGDLKFGFSGMEVTLIDYGLSRARLASGEIIYNNLENDLELFYSESTGIAKIQFDTYRRMRTHLILSTHTMKPKEWHNPTSLPATITEPWKQCMPYTNVLWIRYILSYLLGQYKVNGGDKSHLAEFASDTKELNKRLDVRTKVENGAFMSATEVLNFVVLKGWVSEDQLERYGVDESTLGELSQLIDSSEEEDEDENEEDDEDKDEDDDRR